MRGNGLDEAVVMKAINRAKRRFFLRPTYLARHAGDIARLVTTKWRVVGEIVPRLIFGTTPPPPAAARERAAAAAAD